MKCGLVLEGGGMRGIFTAGVLDFFMKNNITFDNIIGVSAGACHATSYVSNQPGRSFDVSTKYLGDKNYCGLYSFLKTGDIFGAEMIYKTIPDILDPIDFETFNKNPMKMQAVITNARTGKAEYPYISDVKRDTVYIRASSSLPIVSKAVKIGNEEYFDGGVADSIPIRQSEKEGFLKNVVVLTRPRDYRKKPGGKGAIAKIALHRYPCVIEAMAKRHVIYNSTLDYIKEREKSGNVFVIAPSCDLGLARIDKNIKRLKGAYLAGYNEAERLFSQMTDFLNIN